MRVAPAVVDAAVRRMRRLVGADRSPEPDSFLESALGRAGDPRGAAPGVRGRSDSDEPGRSDPDEPGRRPPRSAVASSDASTVDAIESPEPVAEPLRRAHVLVVAVVLAVALVGAIILVVRSRPVSEPIRGPTRSSSGVVSTRAPPARDTTSPSTSVVLVHVAGKVRRPGLIRLRPGARVADAVAAAGGMRPGVDPALLNLARQVVDGEQIVVGASPAPMGPSGMPHPPGPGGTPAANAAVDLNTASLEDLDGLPGVGPVLAQRILDYRTEHGRFGSVDELREVTGIGDRRFEELKARVVAR